MINALWLSEIVTFPLPSAKSPTPKFTVNVLPDTAVIVYGNWLNEVALPFVGSSSTTSPTA